LKHVSWVCRIPQKIKVLVVLSLRVQRDYLQIIQLRHFNAKIALLSQTLVSLAVEPVFPGLGETAVKHGLPIAVVVINVDRIALVISHSRNYSNLCMFFNPFTKEESKI
jgi:hypothetical protein